MDARPGIRTQSTEPPDSGHFPRAWRISWAGGFSLGGMSMPRTGLEPARALSSLAPESGALSSGLNFTSAESLSAVRRRAPKGTFDVLAYQRQRRLNPAIAEQQRRTIRMVKRRARLACLMAYGGDPPKCACCGESNIGFLSLDHVNGGGSEHKRALRKCVGNSFYSKLKNLGFPNDPPLQVLCYNCNLGRQNNRGVCPHHGHDHLSPESSTPQPNGSPFVLLGDDGGLFAGMEDVP